MVKDIDREETMNKVGYVFQYYLIQKLIDMGIELNPVEIELIDKLNAQVLNVKPKYSCNM